MIIISLIGVTITPIKPGLLPPTERAEGREPCVVFIVQAIWVVQTDDFVLLSLSKPFAKKNGINNIGLKGSQAVWKFHRLVVGTRPQNNVRTSFWYPVWILGVGVKGNPLEKDIYGTNPATNMPMLGKRFCAQLARTIHISI